MLGVCLLYTRCKEDDGPVIDLMDVAVRLIGHGNSGRVPVARKFAMNSQQLLHLTDGSAAVQCLLKCCKELEPHCRQQAAKHQQPL